MREVRLRNPKPQLGDARANLLRQLRCIVEVGGRAHDHEFVAAPPHDAIGVAQAASQPRRNTSKNLVADFMAMSKRITRTWSSPRALDSGLPSRTE
jgi:hypothetical protein